LIEEAREIIDEVKEIHSKAASPERNLSFKDPITPEK